MEWTKVSEGKPGHFEPVLITYYAGHEPVVCGDTVVYDADRDVFLVYSKLYKERIEVPGVIAWMSMPEPYKPD